MDDVVSRFFTCCVVCLRVYFTKSKHGVEFIEEFIDKMVLLSACLLRNVRWHVLYRRIKYGVHI